MRCECLSWTIWVYFMHPAVPVGLQAKMSTMVWGHREEWKEWGPHPDETVADYELRVRDTFHFRRKEVPPHLIKTVTVPGMYGTQRTGMTC